MIFTDVFIKRPIFAASISLIVLLVGLISYTNLTVREFPYIDTSVITVNTTYNGANPELMEGFVTTPIEEAISGVEGLDYMESSSTEGSSSIAVHMVLGYDVDKALTEISNKVGSVRWELPTNINDPVVSKQDPNAQPTVYLTFTSREMNPEEVTDYLIRVVQPQLQTIPGVSQAQIFGEREYAMRVWLDPRKMSSQQVTGLDIQNAINNNNILAAAGRVEGKLQEFDVYASTDLQNANQFDHLFIRNDNSHIIQIKDVGKAALGSVDDRVSMNVDSKMTTVVGIIPKSTANPLAVAKDTIAMLPLLEKSMPKDLKVSVLWDTSIFISSSLRDVARTIVEACFFVFLVIFLMIGSFRAVLVPVVTIPLSIVGVGMIMLALNYTINILTLLAFVLAIGLVVDDAIVVLENVHRHLNEGLHPFKAAIIGAREIAFAVIAMTLTLAAVYSPVGFLSGLTGKLFSEFAFTLAGSVLISGFLALTLSPMMCSKLYRAGEDITRGFPGYVNRTFEKLLAGYKHLLTIVLKCRYFVVIFYLIILPLTAYLYLHTPSELAPPEDQGALISVAVGPASSDLEYTQNVTNQVAKIYRSIPETKDFGIINGYPNGVSSAIAFVIFTPWDQRKRTSMQIMNQLFAPLWNIPGMKIYPTNPPTLPGVEGFTPIAYVLKTTGSYDQLNAYTQKFMDAMQKWGGLINIDADLKIDKPQVVVNIDRNKASDLGLPMSEISTGLGIFLGKPITTWFNMQGRSYQVLPQLYKRYRYVPSRLKDLYVRTQSSQLIPLANVAKIGEQIVPRSLNHFQVLRSATITANLAPGYTQGDALKFLNNLATKTLPNYIQSDTTQQLRQFVEAGGKMLQTFLFAIIFIYLILAAQFESFRDPFIVMLSVPLSIAGALALLLMFNGTMNIYTEIGLVTLVGLITKNGILIVEFANQQQEKGLSRREAILTGASMRLRPIMMTTCAMLLGALPLALASGAGAVSRTQIGYVILGGMSFGTILTLFVVPVAYDFFASKKEVDPEMQKMLDEID